MKGKLMNIKRNVFGSMVVLALLLTGAVLVLAQEKQPAENTFVLQRGQTPQAPDAPLPMKQRNDNFVYMASEMSFDGKLVKGAPYSGQGVTEVVQVLADGNRIVNRSTTLIYRDSEGRTRREQTLRAFGPFATGSEPPTTIFITDPVARATYVLDTSTHVARKMPAYSFEWKTTAPPGVRAPAPPPGEGVRVPAPAAAPLPPGAAGQGGSKTEFMIRTPGPDGDPVGGMQFRREGNRKAKSETLGKQTVEGVEAEGTRETITIPAGEIGNELAIEIVNERWYSPELQTLVMAKHSDPRFGQSVYRLTNINRGEQPKTLFEIPGDYTLKTTGAGSGAGGGIGAGTGGGAGIGSGTSFGTPATPELKAPIIGGVLNGKAVSLPLPETPPIARSAKASGTVTVEIIIDEDGNVISAKAGSGHPLLRAAAVSAAREAKFSPTKLSGQPVKVKGVLLYNFEDQ
jgi:TonB family protein